MSGEYGEHALESLYQIKDFKYQPVYLKRPDGSIMTAYKMVDLPACEKGEVAKFMKKQKKIK